MPKKLYLFYNPYEKKTVKIGFSNECERRLMEFSQYVASSYYIIAFFEIPDTISDSNAIHYITDRHSSCRIVKKGKDLNLYESEYFDLEELPIELLISDLKRFREEYGIKSYMYLDRFFIDYIKSLK